MRETKKKLLQETVTILKKLDKESLAIIRSNAEILRARDTLEEQNRLRNAVLFCVLIHDLTFFHEKNNLFSGILLTLPEGEGV